MLLSEWILFFLYSLVDVSLLAVNIKHLPDINSLWLLWLLFFFFNPFSVLEQPPELRISLLVYFLDKHILTGGKKELSTDSKERIIKSHNLVVQVVFFLVTEAEDIAVGHVYSRIKYKR